MNLAIIFESLKFYKMKNERTIQIWFLVLYALNLLIFFLPFVDTDFSGYFSYIDTMLSGRLPSGIDFDIMTTGNWVFIGLSLLMTAIGAFFGLMYATLYVGQNSGMKPREALKGCLAALPRLFILMLGLLIPALVSACFLFLPVIIFAVFMYFLPLNLALEPRSLRDALQKSLLDTRRLRLFIFFEVFLLSLIISLPRSIILGFIPAGILPSVLVATFFTVLQIFVQARLMGILYRVLVNKEQTVIPSKPER